MASASCVSALDSLTHFSAEHPPKKGYRRNEEFINLGSPGLKDNDRVACENERCNREHEPEILNDSIGFLHRFRFDYRLKEFHLTVAEYGIA